MFDLEQLTAFENARQLWLHRDHEEEEERDEEPPLDADVIIASGNDDQMHVFTNFSCDEFRTLWNLVGSIVIGSCSGGRHSKLSPSTWLLVVLYWCKHAPTWRQLGSSLGYSEQHIARKVLSLMHVVAPMVFCKFVRWISMDELVLNHQQFENFPNCLGAVDASVQRIHRPENDQRRWYSGKHKCHCIKVQAMVSPSGLLVDLTGPVCGSVHDLELYRETGLNDRLSRARDERVQRLLGSQPMGALFDKGYIGVGTILPQAILPFKRPAGGQLDARQDHFNQLVSHDRIIVERWFGRHKTLWGVMSGVFPLHGTEEYPVVYMFCAAVTNFHVTLHPLVDHDAVANGNFLRLLREGGEPWNRG